MNESELHILKTAFRLFLQKSFKEVTMKEIVEQSGLSKGAFYHYFESKEQLFRRVVELFFLGQQQQIYDKMPEDSLKAFCEAYLSRIDQTLEALRDNAETKHPDQDMNYFFMAFDALRRVPGFRDDLKQLHQEELDTWVEIVRKARQNGEIDTAMTDEQVAHLFVYANDGLGLRLILEGRGEEMRNQIERLWDGLYRELKN